MSFPDSFNYSDIPAALKGDNNSTCMVIKLRWSELRKSWNHSLE